MQDGKDQSANEQTQSSSESGIQPTQKDVDELYEELGLNKPKERPGAARIRGQKRASEDDDDTRGGRERRGERISGGRNTRNARRSDKNGVARDEDNEESEEEREADRAVSNGTGKTEPPVRGGKAEDEEEDSEDDEENVGKRPQSNPKIERRFQKLTRDIRERNDYIERMQRQQEELEQRLQQYERQARAQDDPEYTIDDFRRVRDEDGNIVDLNPAQAELAYYRWKQEYDERQAQREALYNAQQEYSQSQAQQEQQVMESSVRAYDTLVDVLESYPELDVRSEEFDEELSDAVMPLIENSVIYAPGTEGTDTPVIVGLRVDPYQLVKAMSAVRKAKREMPLNGAYDNVDNSAGRSVPRSQSSDALINQANDLMKELGYNKRY